MSSPYNFFEDEEEEIFVIDSNNAIDSRMNEYVKELREKEDSEKNKYKDQLQKFYENLEYDEEGYAIVPMDEEGYIIVPMDEEGNPLVEFDDEGHLIIPQPEETEPEGSDFESEEESRMSLDEINELGRQIIEDANQQAQAILDQAQEQADAMFEHSKADGQAAGYNEGVARAMDEYKAKEAELEETKTLLSKQYQKQVEDLEKDVVEMVCDIVGKAFGVMFSDNKDILFHLVDNTLMNIENSRVFIIKANEEGCNFLNQNKLKLQSRVGSEAQLDIIMDPLMQEGSCVIETDGGVFDCGLDTQLTNLIKKIKMLSI